MNRCARKHEVTEGDLPVDYLGPVRSATGRHLAHGSSNGDKTGFRLLSHSHEKDKRGPVNRSDQTAYDNAD